MTTLLDWLMNLAAAAVGGFAGDDVAAVDNADVVAAADNVAAVVMVGSRSVLSQFADCC
jgi:hypothetical protein